MEALFKIILTIHIAAGTVSLIVFWIPIFVKKGGDIHIKIGKIYVWLMWIVVLSSLLLSAINLMNGKFIIAAFLGFLSIITAHPLWYGIVILKYKKQISPLVHRMNQFLNWFLFIAGAGLVVWAILLKVQGLAILLMIFGLIGVMTAGPKIFKPQKSKSWMAAHIEGMVGTGIAAYTAFFAFGGSRLFGHIFTNQLMIIPWILPTIIGVYGMIFYKRKFSLK